MIGFLVEKVRGHAAVDDRRELEKLHALRLGTRHGECE